MATAMNGPAHAAPAVESPVVQNATAPNLLASPPKDCGLIADLVADMNLPDAGGAASVPVGTGSAPVAYNVYGTVASGQSAEGARRERPDLGTYRAVAPWVTVYPEVGNREIIAQPQFGPASLRYFSRRAGRYQTFRDQTWLTGTVCSGAPAEQVCTETRVTELINQTSVVQFPSQTRFAGRWPAASIDPHDIQLLTVTVPIRMLSRGPLKGRFLARVGAEYYERPGPIPSHGAHVVAGVSRLREIGREWTTVSFTTLVDSGIQSPGGGQTVGFLIGNPPPCTLDERIDKRLLFGGRR